MARRGLSAADACRPAPSARESLESRLGPCPGPGPEKPPALASPRSGLHARPHRPPRSPRSRRRQQRRPQLEEKERKVCSEAAGEGQERSLELAGPLPLYSAQSPGRPCPQPLSKDDDAPTVLHDSHFPSPAIILSPISRRSSSPYPLPDNLRVPALPGDFQPFQGFAMR